MTRRLFAGAYAVLIVVSPARAAITSQQASQSPGVALALEGAALEKNNDVQGALRKYEQALDVFRRQNKPQGEELVLKFEATLYNRLGQFQNAVDVGVRAVDLARQLGDADEEMIVRSLVGGAYLKLSKYPQALDQMKAAFVVAERAGDLEKGGALADNVAYIYRRMPDAGAAIEWYERARSLKERVGDADGQARILTDLTDLYESGSDDGQLLETYRRRRALAERAADKATAANLSGEIGRLAARMGRTDDAIDSLRAAAAAWKSLKNEAQEALARAQLGAVYSRQGRHALAIEQYTDALTGFERATLPMKAQMQLATALQAGDSSHTARQFGASVDFYQTALRAARSLGDRSSELRILNNLSDSYLELGSFTKALDALQHALSIARDLRDLRLECATLNNFGSAYQGLGQYETAEDFYRQALSAARRIPDVDSEAIALNNLGEISRERGMYNGALEFYRQSLPLMRRSGDRENEAKVLNNIAEVYRAESRYRDALNAYQQSLDLVRDVPLAQGTTLSNMAQLYLAVGQHERAIETATRALTLHQQTGNRSNEATAWNDIGEIKASVGQHSAAIDMFQHGLAIAREIKEPVTQAISLAGIGHAHLMTGQPAKALSSLEAALTIQRAAGLRPAELVSLNGIGFAHYLLHQDVRAEEHFRRAADLAERVGRRTERALALANLGFVAERRRDAQGALRDYDEAIGTLEDVRTSVGVEELKTSWSDQFARLYDHAILLLVNVGETRKAFELAERARARTFLDQVGNGRIDLHQGGSPELIKREQELRQELGSLHRLRAEAKADVGAPQSDMLDSVTRQVALKEREYEEVVVRIKAANPKYASLISVNPLTLSGVQAQLDEDDTLLEYYVTTEKTIAFVVSKKALHVATLPVSEEQITHAIEDFRSFADLNANLPASLKELYALLVAPVSERLTTRRVIVVPHRGLHLVPFGALTDGNRRLGDDRSLSYLPSASMLRFISHNSIDRSRVLAMAQGRSPGAPVLHHVDDEVRAVADLYGTRPLTGGEATESAFIRRSTNASIIHLAAHAEMNRSMPVFSRILLAADRDSDGSLEVRDVYNADLGKVALVVLSACATQLGPTTTSDDIIAFNRAFLLAGVSAVVATLWEVDDKSTGTLMKAFYTHLIKGESKADALRAAQRELRATYPNPYYWAAFVLTGDPR